MDSQPGAQPRALLDGLSQLFARDLAAMQREIAAYPDDDGPWQPIPGLSNSGGTLALHVAGNLRYFIGAVLGGSGYVRDRDSEFSRRGVSRAELQDGLALTATEVRAALASCDPSCLSMPFPVAIAGQQPETQRFLLHLAVHLTYHLGQLDAHRRVVTGDPRTVDALSIQALCT